MPLRIQDMPKGLRERIARDGRERTWLGVPLRACVLAAGLLVLALVFDLPPAPWMLFLAAIGIVAAGVALSYVVLRPAVDPIAIDERLDGRDAVATLLQIERVALVSGPALELLRRDLALRYGARLPAAVKRRVRRRWVLLALLLLLLAFVLPGHRDHAGTGPAAPQAGAPDSDAGGKASPEPSGGAGAQQPRKDPKKPGKRTSQGGSKPKPSGGGKPPPMPAPEKLETLVVFPSFKDSGRKSQRVAPKIDRASRAPSARAQQQPDAAASEKPDAVELRLEWKRQRERALTRGVLLEWETKWLELYGKALDRAVEPSKPKQAGEKTRDDKTRAEKRAKDSDKRGR